MPDHQACRVVKILACVPFFNNKESVLSAPQSLRDKKHTPSEIFALNDGSSDGGPELVEAYGCQCFLQASDLVRCGARQRGMLEAIGELVVTCDATNVPLSIR